MLKNWHALFLPKMTFVFGIPTNVQKHDKMCSDLLPCLVTYGSLLKFCSKSKVYFAVTIPCVDLILNLLRYYI